MIINKLRSILTPKEQSTESILSTDSFADSLILDLRRVINDAVIAELEKIQDKYLSSILRGSHFPIEAISVIPCDHETARRVDEFFRIHTELDKDFENKFFSNNFPNEYRTTKGAKAILKSDILFSIKPSKLGIDNLTMDEEYQINLRGNRKKFDSIVNIGKIKSDKAEDTKNLPKAEYVEPNHLKHKVLEVKEREVNPKIIPPESNTQHQLDELSSLKLKDSKTKKVMLRIKDKNGERTTKVLLPIILGRASPIDADSEYHKVNIDSTYISRNQFVIFSVNNTVYGFIPKEAKVTANLGRRGTLRPLTLIEIENQGLHMTFGQPLDSVITVVNPDSPDLYASVSINLDEKDLSGTVTLIPNVKK